MKINEIYWPDSQLNRIEIEYNIATLVVKNYANERELSIVCRGFAGITTLCIWDDTIIINAQVSLANASENTFVRHLYEIYDKNYDWGGRSLKNGLYELRIELTNHTFFSVYCQDIEVIEQ